ncbi:metal-binding protein [Streptomyces sp. IF17]|nr:metal-binding protein [Streptomyces alkaliphilus]
MHGALVDTSGPEGTNPAPAPRYTLLDGEGRSYRSGVAGRFGGYRRGRIYGRLDCPSALRHIARGNYVRHRVFFADETTAVAAGYRPCSVCLPHRHRVWRKEEPS